MEGLSPLYRRVGGIDVHRMLHVVTVLIEEDDGTISKHQQEFGGFKRDMKTMVAWLQGLRVELVVMESTGIYWKSAHAPLERAGIVALIVNAHFIKHVPGRKTDMGDSEWLAVLARFGLVRGSFIPPKDLRELRLISRYRRKVSQMLASETNRMQKVYGVNLWLDHVRNAGFGGDSRSLWRRLDAASLTLRPMASLRTRRRSSRDREAVSCNLAKGMVDSVGRSFCKACWRCAASRFAKARGRLSSVPQSNVT